MSSPPIARERDEPGPAPRMLADHPLRVMAICVALLYGAAALTACGALLEPAVQVIGGMLAPAGGSTSAARAASGHPWAAAAQGTFPEVYGGPGRGLAESPAAINLKLLVIVVSCTLGGCAFLIAILVISGTISVSVQQRHRDIALLRAIAATPGQVRRMILIETVVVAVLAAVAGVWTGLFAAGWLRGDGLDPAAPVMAPGGYQATVNAQVAQNTWTIHVSVVTLLVYVVIAALNTLAMVALARRTELASLRLAGATRRQILRLVRMEQAVLLGLALIVGGTIAAPTLVPMVKGAAGTAAPYVPGGGWVAILGGTIALSVAGTLLPTARILRIPRLR